MSEMIERVARAIYRQRLIDLGLYEDQQEDASEADDRGLPICRTEARAAIAAMREPTEAMVEAGLDAADYVQVEPAWYAMIDAALAEP